MSRVITALFWVCNVEMNGVPLRNILAWIFVQCPCHNSKWVKFQHISFCTNQWWLCIFPPGMPWCGGCVFFQNTSRQNRQPLGWKWWGCCHMSIVLGCFFWMVSIWWQVLDKGIMCNPACVWQSLHALGHSLQIFTRYEPCTECCSQLLIIRVLWTCGSWYILLGSCNCFGRKSFTSIHMYRDIMLEVTLLPYIWTVVRSTLEVLTSPG